MANAGRRASKRAAAAAVLVLGTAACSGGSSDGPTGGQVNELDTIVTVGLIGGLCPDGPCHSQVRADEVDGQWTATSPREEVRGPVQPAEVEAIASWLENQWDAVTAQPFDGSCPTAVDGQELTITVTRLPTGPDAHLADASVLETGSCRHDWPDSFLEDLRRRWDAAGLPWPDA